MPVYGNETEPKRWSKDAVLAVVFLVAALLTPYLSESNQQRIRGALQVTVLRPFIVTQDRLAESRATVEQVEAMQADLDSLSSLLSTHSALTDENRMLRSLLGLSERAGPEYVPATVLRPGTPGSESMFLVDVGADDGIRVGAPVLSPYGLVGRIREVRPGNAVGMDWSHPEFRASAMIDDGSAYGLVENRPGRFREEDRLVLNGVPFNQPVEPGAIVVTSGRSGVLPRGIPIGRIESQADEQGSWRKSYWLTPLIEPAAATHVLVMTAGAPEDVTHVWAAPDSAGAAPSDSIGGVPPDSVPSRVPGAAGP